MVNFDSYLKVNAQKVEKELGKILSKLPSLAKEFVDACAGGKRIISLRKKISTWKIESSFLEDNSEFV